MSKAEILVGGIGNIFLGDDAFGVEVVRSLLANPLPESVSIADFGIRGLDLSYALLEDYPTVLLVDTIQRGGLPGTLYLLKLDDALTTPAMDTHAMAPASALALAKAMGAKLENVFLLGCEPERFGSENESDEGSQLSEPVAAAVVRAVTWVESILAERRSETDKMSASSRIGMIL